MERTDTEFVPDASKIFENLENSGKGFTKNLEELIDNSMDANAKNVLIFLRPGKKNEEFTSITVVDDGEGFDTLEKFKTCITIASASVTHKKGAIGKFAMGLKQCCSSMANEYFIINRLPDGKIFYCHMDIEKMKSRNEYTPTMLKQITDISDLRRLLPCDADYKMLCSLTHGTMICMNRLKQEYNKSIEFQKKKLMALSITYEYNEKTNIFVNEGVINFVDFMYEKPENVSKLDYYNNFNLQAYKDDNGKLTIYDFFPKTIEIERRSFKERGWYKLELDQILEKGIRTHSLISAEEPPKHLNPYEFDIRVISLSEHTFENEKDDCFSEFPKRNGISTRRGSRYVNHFNGPKYFKMDDHYNRCRMCVSYPPEMDNYFGINASKQQGNSMLSDDIPMALAIMWKLTIGFHVKIHKKKVRAAPAPATAPKPTAPAPAPKPTAPATAPAPAPKPTAPAPAPKPTAPAPAPKPTAPTPAPKPTAPATAPKPTAPTPAPKPTSPATAPKPTAPAPATAPKPTASKLVEKMGKILEECSNKEDVLYKKMTELYQEMIRENLCK